jgi:hypothetical protein
LSRCAEQASGQELEACHRKHQRCTQDCDTEEGVLKV